jgi:hypothetical protein
LSFSVLLVDGWTEFARSWGGRQSSFGVMAHQAKGFGVRKRKIKPKAKSKTKARPKTAARAASPAKAAVKRTSGKGERLSKRLDSLETDGSVETVFSLPPKVSEKPVAADERIRPLSVPEFAPQEADVTIVRSSESVSAGSKPLAARGVPASQESLASRLREAKAEVSNAGREDRSLGPVDEATVTIVTPGAARGAKRAGRGAKT